MIWNTQIPCQVVPKKNFFIPSRDGSVENQKKEEKTQSRKTLIISNETYINHLKARLKVKILTLSEQKFINSIK